ncbi:MAG: ABC transporter ATP-binding protein [Polyangiaceae bacterium]|nr:ABC transporter ATP-binding protein [Polyangiaceae bacterium]
MSLVGSLAARVGALAIEVELDTAGGTLVLIGPNGAGKTTLLSMLLGVIPAERGRLTIGETVLFDSDRGVDLPVELRRIGYVPQDYALFPHLTVRENLAFAVQSARAEATRVEQAFRDFGLESLAGRLPQSLSGGEKQRVALARALSVEPRALLLDEPLAALDVPARSEVRAFLAQTLRARALPSIVVTHDPVDARALGQRLAVLESGKVSQQGTWAELAASPKTRFVEQFVAAAAGGV